MYKKILVLGLLLVSLLASVSPALVYRYTRHDVTLPDDGSIPRQVAYDSANNLICVLTENSARTTRSILRYLPDGTWASATTPSSQLTPRDMAVDSSGNIFNIGEVRTGVASVNKFAIDGTLTTIGGSAAIGKARLLNPFAIAIHGANLYVLDIGVDGTSSTVKRYSTGTGNFIDSRVISSSRAMKALAVGNNWAYFLSADNHILKFPRAGALTPEAEISIEPANTIAVGYVESFGVFVPRRSAGASNLFRYSANLTSPVALGIPAGATTDHPADIAIKSDATVIALLLPETRQLSIYTGSR